MNNESHQVLWWSYYCRRLYWIKVLGFVVFSAHIIAVQVIFSALKALFQAGIPGRIDIVMYNTNGYFQIVKN